MQRFTPILAEVADKEPALSSVFGFAALFSIACLLLSLWRGWGVFIALFPAVFSVIATLGWLGDLNEGPAILRELGQSYVTRSYIAGFLPLVAIGIGVALGFVIRRRRHGVNDFAPTEL